MLLDVYLFLSKRTFTFLQFYNLLQIQQKQYQEHIVQDIALILIVNESN